MEWYKGTNHTPLIFEISESGNVNRIIYLGEYFVQKIYARNPDPLSNDLQLDQKELQNAFHIAINTDAQLVLELSQVLKDKDAKILESVILFKIEECNGWLSNLKRD